MGGTDNFPVLNNSHGTVYYGYDGDVLTYSNSPLTPQTIDNVAYIDADGQPQTADNVFIIRNASEPVTWSAGWYIIQGADVQLSQGAVCSDAVHLILADGAILTATGGDGASAIGGGYKGSASNITVAAALTVRAGDNNPPTTVIMHATDQDIASFTNGHRYATVKDEMNDARAEAIAAINAAIEGVTNEDIIAIATNAIDAVNAATYLETINDQKELALAAIAALKAAYNSGLGEMGVPCTDCPAVDVTKGTTTVKLYNPEKVEFRKME